MLRSLALSLFVLGTLPMALAEPFIGLLLWVLFSYMNPHRLTYGFAYNFHWVMLIAALTLFSMLIHPKSRQSIPWGPVPILLILFLLWTGITTTTAAMESLAVARWVQFFKIQIMVFATLMLVTDRKRLTWLIWVIVLSFGFWAFKGGAFTLLKGGHYHVFGPPDTFFRDNNQFALVMCMTLPLMRYLQLQTKSKWLRYGFWLLMALTVLSIVGTYSRGGLLALLAVLFMLFMKSRNRFGLILVVLVAMPLVFNFLPEKWSARMDTITEYQSNESAVGRLQSWEFATNVAIQRPLTAGGFSVWASSAMWNTYGPPGAVHRAIHSIFFQVLGEQGFIGLALYLALLYMGWRQLALVRRKLVGRSDMQWLSDLAGFMQVGMVGFVAAGAFLPQAYFDFIYQIIALSVVMRCLADQYLSEQNSQIQGC